MVSVQNRFRCITVNDIFRGRVATLMDFLASVFYFCELVGRFSTVKHDHLCGKMISNVFVCDDGPHPNWKSSSE